MAAGDGQRTRPTRLQRYVHHLDHVAGEGRLESIDWPSTQPGLEPVTVIPYEGSPEPGMLTAFTYGVSPSPDQAGEEARVELTISVRSDGLRWGWAVGYLAEQMRGSGHFEQGNVADFHEQPSAESEMTGFLLEHGEDAFWELEWDRYDVRRPPAV